MMKNYDSNKAGLPSNKTWNFPREQPAEVNLRGPFERCRDCKLAGNGFICWSNDGTCMKTQYRHQPADAKKD